MSTEISADWCVSGTGYSMSGTYMKEVGRESLGQRWCFHWRKRQEFFLVVMAPIGPSYYGPSPSIQGPTSDCSDLFPGWEREWREWEES